MKKGISTTAWVVIKCRLALLTDPRWQPLASSADDEFYRYCADYCDRVAPLFRIGSMLPERIYLSIVETLLAQGAAQHYILRKKAIADQIAYSFTEGGQLVVLGGGFDTVALNCARDPRFACFEIDKPAMHRHKMTLIEEFYGPRPPNFYGIGADLSEHSLHEVLAAHPAYDPNQPTIFIAEGITMYLDERSLNLLFSDMRRLCAQASIIFTAIETIAQPTKMGRWLRDMLLAVNQENFSWSIPAGQIESFLSRQGFVQQYLIPYARLQEQWRTDEELDLLKRQNGEYLVYAVANPA